MHKIILFIFGLLLLYSTASAQDYSAEIKQAETLGKLIFEQDQAAWVATDALLEDEIAFEALKPQLKGWVSIKDGKTYQTAFIVETGEGAKAAYDVETRKRKVRATNHYEQPRALSKEERRRWAVRNKLLSAKFEFCPDYTPMNTVVVPVPNSGSGDYYGYLFSATKTPGVIVLGKHYRFTIDRDAISTTNKIEYANSCFAIPKPPKEANVVGAMATHLKTDYPQEHHVFANLVHGVDFYVSTNPSANIWKIRRGKISMLKTK